MSLITIGLPSQVSYIPGTGPQSLFSDASFSLCETETNCKGPSSITANVILETEHIGKVNYSTVIRIIISSGLNLNLLFAKQDKKIFITYPGL